jgi:hypothetical protein
MGNSVYYGNQQAVYLFANDEYRVTPNLTLNAGLRWEMTTVPLSQSKDQPLNAIANVPGLITFGAPKKQMNNYGPRVGFAYSPKALPNTVIRGGFALAYDVLYDNLGILSLPPELQQTCDVSNTPNAQCYWNSTAFLANGGLPSLTPAPPTSAANARQNSSAFVPNQKLPYTETWNFGFQHIFDKNYTLEARYVGTRGIDLPVQSRLNISSPVTATQNLPTFLTQAAAGAYASSATLSLAQLQAMGHYNTAYGAAGFNSAAMVGFMPYGGSKYNGLQVQLGRSFNNGLQYKFAYTWSHAFDNSTADVNSTSLTPRRAQDFQNYNAEWATSALDRRHRVSAELIYDSPFMKKSNNWYAKNLLGNWQLGPTFIFESPEYATVQSGVDANLNGDSASDRVVYNPQGIGNTGSGSSPVCTAALPVGMACSTATNPNTGKIDAAPYVVGYYANTSTAKYITANLGAYANAPRNTLAMAHITNFDLSAVKRFAITEGQTFEFQCHAYNIFNHPQSVPGSLNDVLSVGTSSATIRQVTIPTSQEFNNPRSVFSSNPRVLQLVVKYSF